MLHVRALAQRVLRTPMILYAIRHAESANNALYAATGSSAGRHYDPPLTERGHRQAQLVARHVAGYGPADLPLQAERHDRGGFRLTHLYTSLMIRAIATGVHIAEATGLPLQAWTEIHERGGLHEVDPESGADVGVPGPNRAWFAAQYPALRLPETLGELGWWNRDREPEEDYLPRARVVWRQLLERHGDADDRIAMVTHGGFLNSLLTALVPLSGQSSDVSLSTRHLWFGASNTSISRIEFREEVAVVRYLNRVDHLPDELLS